MDFKDLNNKPHPIDRNFVPAGETQPANALLQNIRNKFAGSTSGISEKEFHEIKECARMLEKYVSYFPKEKGCRTLEGEDMKRWINNYYPNLVRKGPQLPDDRFYSGNNTATPLGIGIDGTFNGEELFQFLYRLFKAMVEYRLQNFNKTNIKILTENIELLNCAQILEKYVSRFPSTKGSVTFDAKDRNYWVSTFYPHFIQKGQQLTDDKFFSSCDTTLGIGTDGKFTGYELFQFLYRLYKEIVQKLSE